MSNSSLSLPLAFKLSLLAILQTLFIPPLSIHPPLRLYCNVKLHLLKLDLILFAASLYSRILLETTLTTV
jgi:hypothetical protein